MLGDESNKYVTEFGVTHVMISDYFKDALEFEKNYVHMSPNKIGYECFCFQRWFVLNEYLKSINCSERIVYLDTDVLIYSNLTDYASKYLDDYDVSVCKEQGPQYTFILPNVLQDLCDFLMKNYADDQLLSELKKYYHDKFLSKGAYGGICDMTLLEWFVKTKKFFDTNIIRDNTIFDNSINASEGFKMRGNIKKVYKDKDGFYGLLSKGEKIYFNGLHFQGAAKRLMYKYYIGNLDFVPSKTKAAISYYKFSIVSSVGKFLKKTKLYDVSKKLLKKT